SRALDPTMTRMVDNEFRVANRGSGGDPWFALETADHPWLAGTVPGLPPRLSPEWLRSAFVEFLAAHEPPAHPPVAGRSAFTPLERAGAAAFRRTCEPCHAARLLADRPDSRIPSPAWEERIFGDGA